MEYDLQRDTADGEVSEAKRPEKRGTYKGDLKFVIYHSSRPQT